MIKQSMRYDQKMDEDIILHEFTCISRDLI